MLCPTGPLSPQSNERYRYAVTAFRMAVQIAFVCNFSAPLRHPTLESMKQPLLLRRNNHRNDILKQEPHAKGPVERVNYVMLTKPAAPRTIHPVDDVWREAWSASIVEFEP